MGAEVAGGIDIPAAASGDDHMGGGAWGTDAEGCICASCLHAGHSGLWVKPANGLGSRLALGGVATTGVALAPRQRRRDRTTSSMRATPTTKANIGSDCLISPSTPVVEGLIIPCVEMIRICRTLGIHDPA